MNKSQLTKILPLLLILFLFASCLPDDTKNTDKTEEAQKDTQVVSESTEATEATEETNSTKTPDLPAQTSGTISVHFIDVGQADSILIKTGTASMLIDGGNVGDGSKVVSYLGAHGIKKVDYLIGTHPHEDHIGGLDDVVKSFEIGKVLMPNVTSNTRTYEYFLNALKQKGLKVTTAKAGQKWNLDNQTKCEILSPISDEYYELNDYSAVIKLTFGNNTFLFTGDAGNPVEQQILSKGSDLKADVLKVAHHGSRHSTSYGFLKAVSPKYAVISLGKDNDYGFPHEETLRRLEGITTFRTDTHGTVVFTSDGNTISVKKEKN